MCPKRFVANVGSALTMLQSAFANSLNDLRSIILRIVRSIIAPVLLIGFCFSFQTSAQNDPAKTDKKKNEKKDEKKAEQSRSKSAAKNAPATVVEPNEEMIAAGYDEAVEKGIPYQAEENIHAEDSADPVALTEADPMSPDELLLQEAGRDLRPDVITPSPDITSTAVADLEANIREEQAELAREEAEGAVTAEVQSQTETDSPLASSSDESAASESDKKQDLE
jgi:hypothetical protein